MSPGWPLTSVPVMNSHEPKQGESDLSELIERLRQIEASDASPASRCACQELVDKLLEGSPYRRAETARRPVPGPVQWLRRLGRCA